MHLLFTVKPKRRHVSAVPKMNPEPAFKTVGIPWGIGPVTLLRVADPRSWALVPSDRSGSVQC